MIAAMKKPSEITGILQPEYVILAVGRSCRSTCRLNN
jgi:hypothetical protein